MSVSLQRQVEDEQRAMTRVYSCRLCHFKSETSKGLNIHLAKKHNLEKTRGHRHRFFYRTCEVREPYAVPNPCKTPLMMHRTISCSEHGGATPGTGPGGSHYPNIHSPTNSGGYSSCGTSNGDFIHEPACEILPASECSELFRVDSEISRKALWVMQNPSSKTSDVACNNIAHDTAMPPKMQKHHHGPQEDSSVQLCCDSPSQRNEQKAADQVPQSFAYSKVQNKFYPNSQVNAGAFQKIHTHQALSGVRSHHYHGAPREPISHREFDNALETFWPPSIRKGKRTRVAICGELLACLGSCTVFGTIKRDFLFECTLCTRTWHDLGSLEVHMKRHLNLMGHECEVCSIPFGYAVSPGNQRTPENPGLPQEPSGCWPKKQEICAIGQRSPNQLQPSAEPGTWEN